ncbi:MAG: hypothetical protein ABI471_12260, partial [Sphingomonas bacterium]
NASSATISLNLAILLPFFDDDRLFGRLTSLPVTGLMANDKALPSAMPSGQCALPNPSCCRGFSDALSDTLCR